MVGVGSNRVIRTDINGRQEMVLEDVAAEDLAEIAAASKEDRFERRHIAILGFQG